ncbi:MAG TPA: FHA domain-containing protein [Solirubrobacteraceae bacterium]|nr:FHA domain-containing protein [Solirubrobacteraceae bacterium]
MATITHPPEEPAAQLGTGPNTGPLHGLGGQPRDPLELLDYRTRRHLTTVSRATPGAYVAFESPEGMRLFALVEGATTIGRALGAQIRLEDSHISRRHATLTYDGQRTQLLDSRSLNGTWVNGERVVSTVLRSGDLIEVGPLVARYLELL